LAGFHSKMILLLFISICCIDTIAIGASKLEPISQADCLEPPSIPSLDKFFVLDKQSEDFFQKYSGFPPRRKVQVSRMLTQPNAKEAPTEDDFRIFEQWVQDADFTHEDLKIVKVDDSFRKIVASKSISRGEILFKISSDWTISTIHANKWFEAISPVNLPNEHAKLAVYLLHLLKNGMDTPHTAKTPPNVEAYLNILPNEFPSNPAFASKQDFEIMEGCWLHALIYDKLESYWSSWAVLSKHWSKIGLPGTTWGDYVWARTIVQTRSFTVVNATALIPMADMLNHQRPAMVEWWSIKQNGTFVMKLTKNVEENVEVYNNYGNKELFKFFLNYGFVPDYRPDSAISTVLRLRIWERDINRAIKKKKIESDVYLKNYGVFFSDGRGNYLINLSRDLKSARFGHIVGMIAMAIADPAEFGYISESTTTSFLDVEIPDNLLYKAWRFLGYWSRERLGAMKKTSVDEDKTILEGLEKYTMTYNIWTILIEEKLTWQTIANEALEHLAKEKKELVERARQKATTLSERNVFVKRLGSGDLVDAMDYLGYWWEAKIIALDKKSKKLLVHFQGFSSVYDEWFPLTGDRLASIHTFSAGGKEAGGVLDQRFRKTEL